MPNRTISKIVKPLRRTAKFMTDNSRADRRALADNYNAAEADLAKTIFSTADDITKLYAQYLEDCGIAFESFDATAEAALAYVKFEVGEVRGEIEYGMNTKPGLIPIGRLRERTLGIGIETSKALNDWSRRLLKQRLQAATSTDNLRDRSQQTTGLPPPTPPEQFRELVNRYSGFSQVEVPQPLNVGKRLAHERQGSVGTPPASRPESLESSVQAAKTPDISNPPTLGSPLSPPRRAIREAVAAACARKESPGSGISQGRSPNISRAEPATSVGAESPPQSRRIAPKTSYTKIARGSTPESSSTGGYGEGMRLKPSIPLRSASRSPALEAASPGERDNTLQAHNRTSPSPAISTRDFANEKPVQEGYFGIRSGVAFEAATPTPDASSIEEPVPLIQVKSTASSHHSSSSSPTTWKQAQKEKAAPDTASYSICPGALILHTTQSPKKYLTVRTVPRGITGSRIFLECSDKDCTFQGAHTSKSKKTPALDTTVLASRSTGIHFRWLFLAKSHLPCSAVDRGQGVDPFTQAYGCLFCTDGDRGGPRLEGVDALLSHILHEHSDNMSVDAAKKWKALLGPVGKPDDDFDLNIPLSCNDRLLEQSSEAQF